MDKIILVGLSIVLLIMVISLICYIAYNNHKTYIEVSKKFKEKLEEEYNKIIKENKEEKQKLENIVKEIKEKEQFNQTLYKLREEELETLISNKKKIELERLDKEIEEWAASAQEAAAFDSTQYQKGLQELGDLKKKELDELAVTINDYKARRDVINQEILRARAIEEQQDFYRVQLPDSSKHDLELLSSIRKELIKVDILDKLLYDNYVKKPVDEMIKRVLKGESPCGIYKITRLKTGEIYIGKSTDIKSRWQQHSKSVYHCGTISHSTLHTIMEKDGIENFTWEVLEEIPKDKLGSREKYWIEFYDSKNFGLNERAGG